MNDDGFGLDDIIDLISDILPPGIAGVPDVPLGAGDEPAAHDADALMAEQAERIPELQEPTPDVGPQEPQEPQEPGAPAGSEPPSAEEQQAMIDAEREQQKMADTLSTLSSMRHQTAMNTIGNIR